MNCNGVFMADKHFSNPSNKSSAITTLLVTFGGFLGLHRFYTGYYKIGIFQLLTCGGFLIWYLVDITSIYTKTFKDSQEQPLVYNNEKFAGVLILLSITISILWSFFYINRINSFLMKLYPDEIVIQADDTDNNSILKQIYKPIDTSSKELILSDDMTFEVKTESGLNIIKSELCYNSKGVRMICGSLVNTNDTTAKNIEIKYHLFDKNKKYVTTATDKIYSLAPREEWQYKVPIYYDTVVDYKFFAVNSK